MFIKIEELIPGNIYHVDSPQEAKNQGGSCVFEFKQINQNQQSDEDYVLIDAGIWFMEEGETDYSNEEPIIIYHTDIIKPATDEQIRKIKKWKSKML